MGLFKKFASSGSAQASDLDHNFEQIYKGEFNPLDPSYGAAGDGSTDDTTALQNCLNAAIAAGGTMVIPGPPYSFKATSLVANGTCAIVGLDNGPNNGGATLFTSSTTQTTPLIKVTAQVKIANLTLKGPRSGAQPGLDLIWVDAANNCQVENVRFDGGYNHLHITDSFYGIGSRLYHDACTHAFWAIDGSTSSGTQWQFDNVLMTPDPTYYPTYAALLDNIGALQISNLQASPEHCTNGFSVNSLATNAGISQFDNCAFEVCSNGPSLHLVGTSGAPIKAFKFTNCYIAGAGASQPALALDYVMTCSFDATYVTSGYRGIVTNYSAKNITLLDVDFEVSDVPIAAANGAVVKDWTVLAPTYTGSSPFVYLPNLTAANTGAFIVRDGTVGTNASPMQFSQTAGVRQKCDVSSVNKGGLTAPTVPAASTDLINPFYTDCIVVISGGTGVSVSIAGTATGLSSGLFVLPAGQKVNLGAYSVAPTWTWIGI